ncbi:ATP-dependent nuclease, subunit B [Ruminococcaceae bacterium BL-6]|nr:ATP-dependent nuclease, subunit B [Ruminococcaceae bacterium BL-6]
MLRLILGRAGSGKTRWVREELCRLAKSGKSGLMLLVPEQYSFESERAMLRLLGAKDAQGVSVVSFTRMADSIFHQYGGFCGRRLDDGGRSILMSLALEQTGEHLPLYRRHARTPELVRMMLDACAELKMCSVSPEDLSKAAEGMEDGTLKEKMTELSLVLSVYGALVAQSYLDPLDDLTRLRQLLEGRDFFRGRTVMIDSFKSFTAQEAALIEIMLRQADDVVMTLCADRLDDPEQGMGLFSLVRRTARETIALARRNSVPVAPPVLLESGARFRGKGLCALEEGVYRPVRHPLREDTGDVVLYSAQSCYDEAEFAAASIRSLVMEQGYRYRDFAVLVRSPEHYRSNLDSALERWEIPYFMDRPRDIDSEPLMHLVLCAFQAVRSGFRSDDVFACLKTGLAGLTAEEISLLENYAFLWKISGKKWLSPWTENPRGFAGECTDRDRDELRKINALREKIVSPLSDFSKEISGADGEKMALAVYRLLGRLETPRCLRELCARLKKIGENELADRQLRLWDMLMGILDQTALVLKGKELPPARFAELLRLVIASGTIASIPQGLDEVTVGVADRTRPAEPKVVFLLGAAQGEFPLNPSVGGLFSDAERRKMIGLGLPLTGTAARAAVEERFLAYACIAGPSERLFVTYPVADAGGSAKSPSSIVSEIRAVLPKAPVKSRFSLPQESFANSGEAAFEMAARVWKEDSAFSATLKKLFSSRPEYTARMKALGRAGARLPEAFGDPAKARALFEGGKHLSATQIETYHLCRFQYFCRYGLNAKERRPAELNALEYGSLMHYLLETFLRAFPPDELAGMDEKELKGRILEAVSRYAELKMGGAENKSPRFRFLVSRIADSALVVLRHIAKELCQSRFRPAAFELELKEGGDFPPLVLTLPGGDTICVEGKIDRVDVMERGGEKYVRIIDYKTGKKEFRLSDVLYGVNMQMLIYLAALIQNGKFSPAGILYMPAVRPIVPAPHGMPPEKREKEIEKRLRMNGLILDDSRVITGMEEKAEGKYIPVALKDGKPARADSVVSREEMDGIVDYIREETRKMAETLYRGDVAAQPLKGDYDACEYCPYFPVCGHEKDEGGRERFRCDKAEALRRMREAGQKEDEGHE